MSARGPCIRQQELAHDVLIIEGARRLASIYGNPESRPLIAKTDTADEAGWYMLHDVTADVTAGPAELGCLTTVDKQDLRRSSRHRH